MSVPKTDEAERYLARMRKEKERQVSTTPEEKLIELCESVCVALEVEPIGEHDPILEALNSAYNLGHATGAEALASDLAVTKLNLTRAESSLERETSWRIRYYRDLVRARDELAATKVELKVRDVELVVARQERSALQLKYDTDLRGWVDGQHQIARDRDAAISRAEAAESRLGEVYAALEWAAQATDPVEIRRGFVGSDDGLCWHGVDHDGTGPSVASALIAAWQAGK